MTSPPEISGKTLLMIIFQKLQVIPSNKNKLIDLATILQSTVTEECLSVHNIDGSVRKTQKSKLLEKFLLTPVLEVPREYVSLSDMGHIWRLATPTPEDKESLHRDGLVYTWGTILLKWLP